MRGSGWALVVFGAVLCLAALLSDGAAGAARVANLSMLAGAIALASVGGSLIAAGCVLIGADAVRRALRPEPQAEPMPAPTVAGRPVEINHEALSALGKRGSF